MSNPLENPYTSLSTIHNTDMFFGRTLLLRRFYASLAHRQSVSITGQRRIGKSSFLWCASQPAVQRRFSFDWSRHIFVFLDLHDFFDKTRDDFFHQVSQRIMRQSAKVAGLTLHAEANGEDTFGSILEQIAEHGYFPVLLLDSFDKVTQNEHFGPQFLGFLRSQASKHLVSYVTSSIEPLAKFCHRGIEGSPFFNIFSTHALGPLAEDEALQLISVPSELADITFTPNEIAMIRDLSGRHPFFIQRVCHAVFDEKAQHGVTEVNVNAIGEKLHEELFSQFEDIWNMLEKPLQQQLGYEAQQSESQYHTLPELGESLLFRQFIGRHFQRGQFDIDANDLERALSIIDDPKKLGETNLQFMQIVVQRLRKNTSPSSIDKGVVIREVLREALNNLKPGDIGSSMDMNGAWLHYNVLYLRYFKRHLTNAIIAGRLAFSERNYYRKHDAAIEALLVVLLDMERKATAHV